MRTGTAPRPYGELAIERKSHIIALVADEGLALFCRLNAMRAEHEVANADICKGEEAIFRLTDFWKRQHGKAPPHLVFDSKLTTYTLDRLDAEGITFLTLRRRSPKLLAEAANLPASAWRTVELDIPHRKYRAPRIYEQTARPLGHAYRSSSSPISATTSPRSCSPTTHARPSKISSPAMSSACSSRMRSPTRCASFTSMRRHDRSASRSTSNGASRAGVRSLPPHGTPGGLSDWKYRWSIHGPWITLRIAILYDETISIQRTLTLCAKVPPCNVTEDTGWLSASESIQS
jgi:hypothetical protein